MRFYICPSNFFYSPNVVCSESAFGHTPGSSISILVEMPSEHSHLLPAICRVRRAAAFLRIHSSSPVARRLACHAAAAILIPTCVVCYRILQHAVFTHQLRCRLPFASFSFHWFLSFLSFASALHKSHSKDKCVNSKFSFVILLQSINSSPMLVFVTQMIELTHPLRCSETLAFSIPPISFGSLIYCVHLWDI